MSEPFEVAVLSVNGRTAVGMEPGSGRRTCIRAAKSLDVVPGEMARFSPDGSSTVKLESVRIDAAALGLTPLRLHDRGLWDPKDEYWGEPNDPLDDHARASLAWGPRHKYEMEQVIPGEDPEDASDPIIDSVDLKRMGDRARARKILMKLCEEDLRCLDAHAHLGNLVFNRTPEKAIRHYEMGVRIGELSLGPLADGLLPWGMIDNRPFLRCLNGYGLCLWRLKRFAEAERVFDRLLWLNPGDNQGIRGLIDEVRAKEPWLPDLS